MKKSSEKGFVPEIKNFEQAVIRGDTEQVKTILAQNHKAFNTMLFKDTNALAVACGYGHTECAQVMIEHGAPVNRYPHHEFAPLHSACSHGHMACVQLLIDHGAHIDEVTDDFSGCDEQDKTALHVGCGAHANGTSVEDCIRLLIKHGANINAQDASGKTPLHYAYLKPRLIVALLELGANPDIRDRMGDTVLDVAQDTRFRYPNEYCLKLLRQNIAQKQ